MLLRYACDATEPFRGVGSACSLNASRDCCRARSPQGGAVTLTVMKTGRGATRRSLAWRSFRSAFLAVVVVMGPEKKYIKYKKWNVVHSLTVTQSLKA